MFENFLNECEKELKSSVKKLHKLELGKVYFSEPPASKFGDASTSISFELSKELKKAPKVLADEIAGAIKPKKYIKEVRAVNGYLNFYLNYLLFAEELFSKINESFGKGRKKKKAIIEHTSANPDGPLHIGHLRNAVIGDVLARILKFYGFGVETHYYLNDMGKQIAKVVWGMDNVEESKKEEGKKPDHYIADVYIAANKIIEEKNLEEEVSKILSLYEKGDKETEKKFRNAVEKCLAGINETLERLGIRHDKIIWESSFVKDRSVGKIIETLKKTKYAKIENGALYLDLSEFGIEKGFYLKRKDDTTLYAARDLAYHVWKLGEGECINILGADHKLHAEQLNAALKILGFGQPEVIVYEFISLPSGRMSTRKGVYVSVDEIIEETVKKTYEEVSRRRKDMGEEEKRAVAEKVAIGAIRFNIAKVSPEKQMFFKWEEALDFEKQGMPFVLYAYARASKILAKAAKDINIKGFTAEHFENLDEPEKVLVKTLSKFPLEVKTAAELKKPANLARYLLELADAFHKFYIACHVIGSEKEELRLGIVKASAVVLKSAISIFGAEPIEEM